jgi:hypothetical protein
LGLSVRPPGHLHLRPPQLLFQQAGLLNWHSIRPTLSNVWNIGRTQFVWHLGFHSVCSTKTVQCLRMPPTMVGEPI